MSAKATGVGFQAGRASVGIRQERVLNRFFAGRVGGGNRERWQPWID